MTGTTAPAGPLPAAGTADVLCHAAARNQAPAVRRLLDAGADPGARGGDEAMPALHWACWFGALEAASRLVERGASLTELNGYGGTALGAAIHGSVSCHDPEGGATMRLPEEVRHGDYAGVVEVLIAAGSPLPARIRGSDAVADVLRRHGVPEDGSAVHG
jgi:hypothetical protein